MPVIQIEIMQHGALDQSRHLGVKVQFFVEFIAEFRDALTVLICAYFPVLCVILHLLDMFVRLEIPQYFVHFLFVSHLSLLLSVIDCHVLLYRLNLHFSIY